MADPVMAQFVDRLWRSEDHPALTPPPGTDLAAYADALARVCHANPRSVTGYLADLPRTAARNRFQRNLGHRAAASRRAPVPEA